MRFDLSGGDDSTLLADRRTKNAVPFGTADRWVKRHHMLSSCKKCGYPKNQANPNAGLSKSKIAAAVRTNICILGDISSTNRACFPVLFHG